MAYSQNRDLLANWKRQTSIVGMDYLRSTCVHHIDPDPFSLKRFARANGMHSQFTMPYERPSVALFQKHAEFVFATNRSSEMKLTGAVREITRKSYHYKVSTSEGVLQCRKVVLALNTTNWALMPSWVLVSLQAV